MKRILAAAAVCGLLGAALAAPPAKEKAEGPKLLFASNRSGNSEIYLAEADGTNAKNLTDNKAEDTFPAWSPDGKKIAFHHRQGDGSAVYLMDADGSNSKELIVNAELPEEGGRIVWKPK